MPATLLRPVLSALGLTQIRHVAAVRRRRATATVVRVYQQMEEDFGVLAPPVGLHAPAPEVLAATWTLLRETLIVPGTAPRATKEAVATAVSLGNACPYCATIHNSALSLLGIADREAGAEWDVEALADWVLLPQRPDGPPAPPFPPEQTAELVGVAVLLHYLNRMTNVFLRDVPLPPGVPDLALSPVLWVLSRVLVRASRAPHRPGESLDLLPAAALPDDLMWARDNESVAGAFARACAAMDEAGRRSVPPEVRALVVENLAGWRGGLRGISRSWVEELISGLPERDRAGGRLALLVAFASYQVDDGIVEQARRAGGLDDRTLVELCSWAAMVAARRVSALLPLPPEADRKSDPS
ncbi:carboxymuconolactone decarboxylase family protein [Phytohabitans kaempferiae]|uniref:Carboxymuconolactone decarboxylase family protein n=1 Tax=Phytohabitans kaempferiae TaxID=1620943 RepID=A0ABV6M5L7_9ACTN